MGQYAGDIAATEAWDILSNEPGSALIDVRTEAEWQFAGVPNLSALNKKVIFLPLRNYPNYDVNQNFASALNSLPIDKDQKVLFLCKVGGRSIDAAVQATELGFKNAYNIIHGFEGSHDAKGQRGKVDGWKAANLPWVQA